MMKVDRRRVRAVLRKELREYRHNGNIIYAMVILPIIFTLQPVIEVLTLSSSASGALRHEHALVYMLGIPALVPAALASYSIVGERLQGTLEPLLATPVRREELLLGKALAAFMPAVLIAYVMFGVYIAIVEVFAAPGVAAGLIHGDGVLAQLLFTPLLTAWSTWVGIAVSARARDVRAAGQLSVLAGLPSVLVTSLIAFNVIPADTRIVLGLAAGLLILDRLGWRGVSALFDRERLITSTR